MFNPKFKLLKPYNFTCRYVFWSYSWHWTNNWCAYAWKGPSTSLLSKFTRLLVVLCVLMTPHGRFLIQSDMFLGTIFVQLTFGESYG